MMAGEAVRVMKAGEAETIAGQTISEIKLTIRDSEAAEAMRVTAGEAVRAMKAGEAETLAGVAKRVKTGESEKVCKKLEARTAERETSTEARETEVEEAQMTLRDAAGTWETPGGVTTWEIKIPVTIVGECKTESLVDVEEDDAVAGEAESETEVAKKAKTRAMVRMTKMEGRAREAETLERAQEAERDVQRETKR